MNTNLASLRQLNILSKSIGKPQEEIELDINRPKYFTPVEAVEYGIIDKVMHFVTSISYFFSKFVEMQVLGG